MPYLRLYTRDLPIEQKRFIAQKLIEITLRTFKLRANQRYQTSVQFISTSHTSGGGGLPEGTPRGADFTLEVMGHDLTEEKKRAFAEEAAAVLAPNSPLRALAIPLSAASASAAPSASRCGRGAS